MTRYELGKVKYFTKLKREAEQELERLIEERQAKAQKINGMPFSNTGTVSDPTAKLAIAIDEQIDVVRAILINLRKKENEVWQYLKQVEQDDIYLYMIIKYHCLELLSWEQVARKIGASTTADACRMYYVRNIPRGEK